MAPPPPVGALDGEGGGGAPWCHGARAALGFGPPLSVPGPTRRRHMGFHRFSLPFGTARPPPPPVSVTGEAPPPPPSATGADFGWKFTPEGIAPVLSETWCRYRRPVDLPDDLHVAVRVEEVRQQRGEFVQSYVVWSERLQDVAAKGGARVVLCDFEDGGKRTPIPEWLMQRLLPDPTDNPSTRPVR